MSGISNGFSILSGLAEAYEGSCLYLFAALTGLALLAFFGGKRMRDVFLYPCIILLCTVFNPLVLDALYRGAEDRASSHVAFFWALPVVLLIASSAILLGSAFTNPFLRALPAALVIAVALTTGAPDVSAYAGVNLPSNLLKADPELVSLITFMDEKSTSDMYSAAFENSTLRSGAEEYSAEVVISDLFVSEEDAENETSLREAAAKYNPDFLVVDRGGSTADLLAKIGYTELAHTDTCSVYAAEP